MFDNYFFKYGLHDTLINDIKVETNKIVFYFNNGVYLLDENGKETTLSNPCQMEIYIDNFDSDKAWEHIEITKIKKNKMSELELDNLIKLVEKNSFEIYLDYHCNFANSLLLIGYIKNSFNINLKITEINKISFIF